MASETDTVVRIAIDKIIKEEEGGWKLTHNPNDPDGGWTYAGVTAKTFNSHLPEGSVPLTYADMVKAVELGDQNIKETVFSIYFKFYYKPLEEYVNGMPQSAELSCAINCGVGVAKNLINKESFDIHEFCHAWTAHYVQLVVNNARAWMEYAEALEECVKNEEQYEKIAHQKPSTFRADFLQGWINRVERYRDD